jgi:FMN phosphatase YigB (HAD superfamily)
MTHKCIAFDIGEVLCRIDWTNFKKRYNELCEDGFRKAEKFLHHIQREQDIGLLTVQELLEDWLDIPYDSDIAERIVKEWNEAAIPNQEMLDFKDELVSSGFEIALLSNMGKTHMKYLKKTCPRLFDDCILHLSCQVGARKPTKLYFQSFLLENPHFRGALFVDDCSKNLKMASDCGLRPYKFELSKLEKLRKYERECELKNIKACAIQGPVYTKIV